jgi:hypothetical protein
MTDNQDLNGFLKDQDQTLMAAWTLPNDGSLTDSERKQAMANFAAYCKRRDITPHDVGREIGTPRGTTIRDLIIGKYRENADQHVRILNAWVEQHARREAAKLDGDFVDTRVAGEIRKIAQLVLENGTMGLAVGPTGIGKTRCALAFKANAPGAVFVTIRHGAYAPTGLIRLIARELGFRKQVSSSANRTTQFDRVLDELRGSNRLLIVDEAHKLNDDAIEVLREIHDDTGCPVLLLATKDLQDRVERTAQPDAGQLHSRFDVNRNVVQGYSAQTGGKKLFTVEQIRKFYEKPPLRLSADAADYLLDVANLLGWGSLRRCRVLVMNGARRARKRQSLTEDDAVTITADDLAYADSLLRPIAADQELIRQQRSVVAATA